MYSLNYDQQSFKSQQICFSSRGQTQNTDILWGNSISTQLYMLANWATFEVFFEQVIYMSTGLVNIANFSVDTGFYTQVSF